VECGAQVIVTQPPLVWPRFEAWLDVVNACARRRPGALLPAAAASACVSGARLLEEREVPAHSSQSRRAPGPRRGLTRDARILVGLPMLTSAESLAFWLDLCRAGDVPGAAAALRAFREADAGGRGAEYGHRYVAELATKARCACPMYKGARPAAGRRA